MKNSNHISFRNTMPLISPEAAGKWIRTMRKARGLTQSELAFEAAVTQHMVSEFESGKVTVRLDTFFRLLQALDLRLATIDPSVEIPEEEKEEFEW